MGIGVHWRVQRDRGFSLLELLVVVTILSVVITLCLPALGSLLGTRGMTKALQDISDLIELARNEAMTSQGYVYLAFADTTNALGNDELQAVVLSSPGGRAASTSSGGLSYLTKLRPSSRKLKWENLKLADWNDLSASIRELKFAPEIPTSVAAQKALDFQLPGAPANGVSYQAIVFSPQGYAMFQRKETYGNGNTRYGELSSDSPYERFIDIGLKQTRAGRDGPNLEDAALVLNGVNGHAQILRRQ